MTSVEDAVPDARVATPTDAERDRLSSSNGDLKPWRVWGPYVAGRQWGTVREERLFLTNPQGNHGEDVKEFWWHLDATPTHSYAE